VMLLKRYLNSKPPSSTKEKRRELKELIDWFLTTSGMENK